MAVKFQGKYLEGFVKPYEFDNVSKEIELCHDILHQKSGAGNDYLGWLNLPFDYDKAEFEQIKKSAEKIRNDSEVLVVIGIGGSYLGARAAIEFLGSPFYNNLDSNKLKIYFVGNNISGSYLNHILSLCKDKELSVNVISKSGTTTESALAFRVFKELMEEKYGKEGAKERIYATTDKARGTLKSLSDKEGYQTFVIPDDVGGRFSVLTAVGLLPIAAAGFDIDKMMLGAQKASEDFAKPGADNDCYKYAAARNILYRKGKAIELMACYEPNWQMMNEWYKQLYGESEGKDQKGIFPASVIFSTDLHSMGQFVQDGSRNIFETVVTFKNAGEDYFVKADENNFDGLNFLANQPMSEINKKAMQGTVLAHVSGGVPNIVLEVDAMDEENFGYVVYFFEKACAISGYMNGVNPFNQPGVEDYKVNMFALLGKPGYEAQREELLKKLGE
ncbi:MAG: glucose-6-phosphate isomerase [Oscillospiraceae bacterium]|nr:glucose-6-phosphate isomerase [Oscillospiraceae bacterium]MBP1570504.1 glucose-6-phosphate isomerase [Oscillospiraceae bacterium]MBQ5314363.1 glucose-6-phosphate isomerase [Oscillospiraceae bacterium]MBQ5324647.1 glucose-6-phosphate isomerase [Oscillospiraceae bacterium]